MKVIIVSIVALLFVQACVATPNSIFPDDQCNDNASDHASVEAIKHNREALYAKKLKKLKKRKPKKDAYSAIARGHYYLMSYRSGRRGVHKVPGLTKDQLDSNHCKYRIIAGLEDTIYGENHLKYRIAIRRYASIFNKSMFPHCN